MSRQVRYRVSALVLGGFLLGAPLLISGPASADQRAAGGNRQVVFGGSGVFALSCRSRPDVGSISVPADTTLRMVNHTGHKAKLRLSGATKGTLPDRGSTDVVFRRGTTAVLLNPNCPLGDEATPLLVTATPTNPATMPDPIPSPSETAAHGKPFGSPGTPTSTGPAVPHSPAAHPQHPVTASTPGTVRATTSRPSATRSRTDTVPRGGPGIRVKIKTSPGTGTSAPASVGMPGDDETLPPGVPMTGLSQAAEPAPAPSTMPTDQIAPAEPAADTVAEMPPIPDSPPIGLLVLTATVCLLGVACGTIRAIVSQRASRTKIA
jgi:hypothetical protein